VNFCPDDEIEEYFTGFCNAVTKCLSLKKLTICDSLIPWGEDGTFDRFKLLLEMPSLTLLDIRGTGLIPREEMGRLVECMSRNRSIRHFSLDFFDRSWRQRAYNVMAKGLIAHNFSWRDFGKWPLHKDAGMTAAFYAFLQRNRNVMLEAQRATLCLLMIRKVCCCLFQN
jgi:hypothetical protein